MKRRIDRVLDNLERMIGALLISFFGMISYLFVNIEKLSSSKIWILVGGMALVIVAIAVLGIMYKKYLNKIQE